MRGDSILAAMGVAAMAAVGGFVYLCGTTTPPGVRMAQEAVAEAKAKAEAKREPKADPKRAEFEAAERAYLEMDARWKGYRERLTRACVHYSKREFRDLTGEIADFRLEWAGRAKRVLELAPELYPDRKVVEWHLKGLEEKAKKWCDLHQEYAETYDRHAAGTHTHEKTERFYDFFEACMLDAQRMID